MFIEEIHKHRASVSGSVLRRLLLWRRLPAGKMRSGVVIHLVHGEAKMLVVSAGQPEATERIEMPPEVMDKNEIRDPGTAAFFIRQLTKKFPAAGAAVGIVPEEEIFRRFIQVEKGEEERRVLARVVPDLLPFAPEEMVWEWRIVPPLGGEPTHSDIEIVAVPRGYIVSYYDTIRSAKLLPVNFLPESTGILKLLFPVFQSPFATLVIFSDRHRTLLLVFAGHAVHVTSVLPYGERELVGEAASALIEEVKRVTLFYQHRVVHEHGASSEVDQIVIFGDIEEEVRNLIALNTQIRPEVFNIWAGGIATDFVPLIGAAKSLLE